MGTLMGTICERAIGNVEVVAMASVTQFSSRTRRNRQRPSLYVASLHGASLLYLPSFSSYFFFPAFCFLVWQADRHSLSLLKHSLYIPPRQLLPWGKAGSVVSSSPQGGWPSMSYSTDRISPSLHTDGIVKCASCLFTVNSYLPPFVRKQTKNLLP